MAYLSIDDIEENSMHVLRNYTNVHKKKSVIIGFLILLSLLFSGCFTKKTVVKKDKQVFNNQPKRTAEDAFQDGVSTYASGKSSGHIDYDKVIRYYREALNLRPNMQKAAFNLAAVYEEIGKYDAAARIFSQLVQSNPNNETALYRLVQVKVKQKRFAPALSLFLRYMRRRPERKKDPKMLANLSALQLGAGNHESALQTARKILVFDPNSLLAYRLLARVYLTQRKYNIVHLVKELTIPITKKTGKKDAGLLNIQGLAFIGQKDYPKAILTFSEATKVDPSLFSAQMNLGLLALKYYDYNRALTALQQAARLRPRNRKALISYALALRANRKYQLAEKIYTNHLLKQNRHDSAALFNLGLLYLRFLKKPKKAKTMLRRFIGEESARISENHIAYKLLKEAEQAIKAQEYLEKMKQQQQKQTPKKGGKKKV